jgi:hypothetical protein
MNRGEIKAEILVRSGKDTTSAWISEAFLNDWIDQAHKWAGGYKPWPFTQGRVSTTYTSLSEEWNFEGYKAASFRLIQIGGKRLKKLNFESYQKVKEDRPDATDRIAADFGGILFINTLIDASGTLTAWGQYQPAVIPDGDDNDAVNTVFSGMAEEGNEAIIEEVLSKIANRDEDETKKETHHKTAAGLLDALWGRFNDENFKAETDPKGDGMFQRFDVINGRGVNDLTNRDQFPD